VEAHVVLGAGHPEDATDGQFKEVREVDVSLVKQGDFAVLEARAELPGPRVVVMAGFLDDGKGRQEGSEIEPQVAFRSGLAPPVFRPVHAVGHKGNRAGIHRVNCALETSRKSLVAQAEAGALVLEVFKSLPEEFLGHVAVANFVGMRKRIARGWHRCADGGERSTVVTKTVTDVVETDGSGELGVEEAHHMAPRGERSCFLLHLVLSGKFGDEMPGNELAYLSKNGELRCGWFIVFHQADPRWDRPPATLFFRQAMGRLCFPDWFDG